MIRRKALTASDDAAHTFAGGRLSDFYVHSVGRVDQANIAPEHAGTFLSVNCRRIVGGYGLDVRRVIDDLIDNGVLVQDMILNREYRSSHLRLRPLRAP